MKLSQLQVVEEWEEQHRDVLREAASHWLRTGSWLTVDQLGRSALRRGSADDVFDALGQLPAPLGRVDRPSEQVILRVRALAVVPDSEPYLREFVRALDLAALRLRSDETDPVLNDVDLTEVLGVHEPMVEHVSQLILNETGWSTAAMASRPKAGNDASARRREPS